MNASKLNASGGYSGPARGGSSYGPKIECGVCNTSCVYSAIECGFLVGIIANIIVIVSVCRDKKLRDSTFVAVACLAFADALFMAATISRSVDYLVMTAECSTISNVLNKPYYIIFSVAWFAANSHVALLSILRYVTITYPLRSHIILTKRRVIYMSVGVWICGVVVIGTLTILISYSVLLPGKSNEFVLILWFIVYLIPLVVTAVLHLLKIFILRKTTQETATDATRKSIARMSKIVLIVILFATILPLPRMINKFVRASGGGDKAYSSKDLGEHFTGISELLFILNNCINPFVYGFMSKRFRKSILNLFRCRLKSSEKKSQVTMDTPLSIRKRNISMDSIDPKLASKDSLDNLDRR
ncbi:somatostatin receptor type 4-like [Dreissena polymorpha]|uniref:G-protein coupled receptors family 1 profile domain-containing protein n=1 Tax=Dreissena polymorpha TaxID=45954 RepID=A0A9D4DLZ0_DREPO|nr:somatostatin receptor type 4-like [Dreissena polymorpha]KAH3750785.1 hypothetical protein DPMN_185318 [Dreissena polymorpha]